MTEPADDDPGRLPQRPAAASEGDRRRSGFRRATAARVWGWRALLVLPIAFAVFKLCDLRDQPVSPAAWTLVVVALGVLTVGAVRVWRSAPGPWLTHGQAQYVLRGIPRDRRRVLHRALHRRGPLPPELRDDATRYAWASRFPDTTWFVLAVGAANAVPATGVLDDDVFSLVVALLLAVATAGFLLAEQRLTRRAHELGLPLTLTGPGVGDGERG